MTFDDKWFEVWFVSGVEILPAYLVVVFPNPGRPGEILVIDLDKNKRLFAGANYEEVFNWLTEDEFQQVTGREFFDDGWTPSFVEQRS
jgi:hypothetical protein